VIHLGPFRFIGSRLWYWCGPIQCSNKRCEHGWEADVIAINFAANTIVGIANIKYAGY
jgi:hypothetical protein